MRNITERFINEAHAPIDKMENDIRKEICKIINSMESTDEEAYRMILGALSSTQLVDDRDINKVEKMIDAYVEAYENE